MQRETDLLKGFSLGIDERLVLRISGSSDQRVGDSIGLERGLILFVENRPVIGEGVGFGVPAIEYSNEIFFSSSATNMKGDELVKSYSIDTVQRKTWRGRFPIDTRVYRMVQGRLADVYRTDKRFRPALTEIMHVQSLMGIRLTHQRVTSRGYVDVSYNPVGRDVKIIVDCSRLMNKDFRRLLIFNEQSAEFNMYQDDFGTLRDDRIGVWEEVKSRSASLKNQELNVGFGVENVPGTRLYRGRELLRPRLDWAGFCYSIPPETERFTYTIQIA